MKSNRILAVALSAGLVLAGGVSIAHAETGYATEAEAKAAAEKSITKEEKEYKSYTVMKGVDGKFYFNITEKADPLEAPKEKESSNRFDQHDIGNNEVGFVKREFAEQEAKWVLKNDKVNKSYEIVQTANGRWSYVLSPFENKKPEEKKEEKGTPEVHTKPEYKLPENKPEVKPSTPDTKPSTPAENDKEVDKLIKDLGESEKKINDLLEQNEKENAELNKKDKKEKDKKEADKKDKKKQAPAKKGNNPKTGVVGLGSVASLAAISMAGIVATRKRK